ncbi:hypothetical protein Desti_2571 [Desulfomonile tiedjei DSM 6799]|uniref:Uncharacterized protein n=1 Tax=Desulfomonile tiedjei (strain ATCC 49306 / DSM 6799 / DCB-1) TaxID=706587 RepID=I4C6R0_DESTA|nr:hypothetical protein Desti_2571 [Desulfomonile tiedjei DSM 6799]
MNIAQGVILVVGGVIGLVVTRHLTCNAYKKSGLDAPTEFLKAPQDAGIVPRYVSILNLASWLMVIVGMFRLGSRLTHIF